MKSGGPARAWISGALMMLSLSAAADVSQAPASFETLDAVVRAISGVSLFQIGSVTKVFTAAAIASAAEDGVLALDAPNGRRGASLAPPVTRRTRLPAAPSPP